MPTFLLLLLSQIEDEEKESFRSLPAYMTRTNFCAKFHKTGSHYAMDRRNRGGNTKLLDDYTHHWFLVAVVTPDPCDIGRLSPSTPFPEKEARRLQCLPFTVRTVAIPQLSGKLEWFCVEGERRVKGKPRKGIWTQYLRPIESISFCFLCTGYLLKRQHRGVYVKRFQMCLCNLVV